MKGTCSQCLSKHGKRNLTEAFVNTCFVRPTIKRLAPEPTSRTLTPSLLPACGGSREGTIPSFVGVQGAVCDPKPRLQRLASGGVGSQTPPAVVCLLIGHNAIKTARNTIGRHHV